MNRIYLSCPTMHGEELLYVKEAFDTNWVAPLGPNVDRFEQEMSSYLEAHNVGQPLYGAALSSGTAALHLALINAGVGAGDLVFCSDLTFSASCNPICYQKAIPVFIDSERDSWNMDPGLLKKAFQMYPKPKAVIIVNLYGTPARLEEISEICMEQGVTLIEDAAESLGAAYRGKQTGTFGNQGVFSFNGNKIITSSGGGMLVSEDEELVKHARFLSTQAREPARHYEHKELGYNYRMSNVVAGIGRGQLIHLDEHIAIKKRIYGEYQEKLGGIGAVTMNPIPAECEANYWLSCMTLSRECPVKPLDIMLALEKENIECRPIWKPMHQQPVFKVFSYVSEGESVSEDIFERGLCLPSDIKNTDEDMKKITRIIRGLF